MKNNLKNNDIIQDLWILEDSGIVIFSRVANSKIEEQLFGGIMTALNHLSVGLNSNGLSCFESRNMRYTMIKSEYKTKKYLFLCNSSKKIDANKIMERLNQIKDKFFEIYGPKLKEWDGDLEMLLVFNNQFEQAIKESAQNFYPSDTFKSFWNS